MSVIAFDLFVDVGATFKECHHKYAIGIGDKNCHGKYSI